MDSTSDCQLSHSLSKRNGYLYCEEVKIKHMQEELTGTLRQPSPVYVYSKTQLLENVKSYSDALQQYGIDHLLGYSVKANYNPNVSQCHYHS